MEVNRAAITERGIERVSGEITRKRTHGPANIVCPPIRRAGNHHLRVIGRLLDEGILKVAKSDRALIASAMVAEFPRPRRAELGQGFISPSPHDDYHAWSKAVIAGCVWGEILVLHRVRQDTGLPSLAFPGCPRKASVAVAVVRRWGKRLAHRRTQGKRISIILNN